LRSPNVSFEEALLKGLAPDGGLYMPVSIPELTKKELESLPVRKYCETAYIVLSKLIGDEIDKEALMSICNDAYNYDVPIEKVDGRKYILRLDRGPTASFKDFAARMMSRLMQYYLARNNRRLTILTATSGDTGSAVASAFYGLKNINVIILFPSDEVSDMQRKQMTTLRDNIKVIALNGKFDDCQRLVKTAFLDNSLSHASLSSANSINIGRLLPQSVYYIYTWSKLIENLNERVVFSVPSGNFGNLMGGLVAKNLGMPLRKFLITTNDNDEVPAFVRSGNYKPIVPSKNCISSAMNVGHPSNLARIVALYGGSMDEKGQIYVNPDLERMRDDFFTTSVSEDITRTTIKEVFDKYKILLEPHGAVAWEGVNRFIKLNKDHLSENQIYVSLETAHPAKFPDEIKKITGVEPSLPPSLSDILGKDEEYVTLENNYEKVKEFISKNY
jgi:threonine synthase